MAEEVHSTKMVQWLISLINYFHSGGRCRNHLNELLFCLVGILIFFFRPLSPNSTWSSITAPLCRGEHRSRRTRKKKVKYYLILHSGPQLLIEKDHKCPSNNTGQRCLTSIAHKANIKGHVPVQRGPYVIHYWCLCRNTLFTSSPGASLSQNRKILSKRFTVSLKMVCPHKVKPPAWRHRWQLSMNETTKSPGNNVAPVAFWVTRRASGVASGWLDWSNWDRTFTPETAVLVTRETPKNAYYYAYVWHSVWLLSLHASCAGYMTLLGYRWRFFSPKPSPTFVASTESILSRQPRGIVLFYIDFTNTFHINHGAKIKRVCEIYVWSTRTVLQKCTMGSIYSGYWVELNWIKCPGGGWTASCCDWPYI